MELTGRRSPLAGPDFEGLESLGGEVWLVLGGGGVKGLAHIGAWEALLEAGVRPKGIVGTSIGAMIGALISSGMSTQEMRGHALALERSDIVRVNRRVAWINGIRQVSVFHGEALRDHYAGLLPSDGWDAMEIPLLVNTVRLEDGSTEWFGGRHRTDVPLADVVYASSALPVLYPPFMSGDQALVDGGTAHPLPLKRAAREGATGIIGIDVGSGEKGDIGEILKHGLVGVHQRIYAIMTFRRRNTLLREWSGPPLMYVRPELDGYATFDFDNTEYFLDEGYRATKAALAAADE